MCSVGNVVGESCISRDSTGLEVTTILNWNVRRRTLLHQRIEAHVATVVDINILKQCCMSHLERFESNYLEQEKALVGCANPLLDHESSVFQNLLKVNDGMFELVREIFPYLLQGRQVCQECWTSIRSIFDRRGIKIVPLSYDFGSMQDLYQRKTENVEGSFEKVLRPFQAQALFYMLAGNDVLCCLPTNYGKTLPMVMASYLSSKVKNVASVTLLISPLLALMKNFIRRLSDYKLTGIRVGLEVIKSGNLHGLLDNVPKNKPVYLITPEHLNDSAFRAFLCSIIVDYIVVDECHVSSDWAKSFRPEYGSIHEVRQFLTCPIALFTATLTKSARNDIIKNTGVRRNDLVEISDNPDRPEIFLQARLKQSFASDFDSLAKEIISLGQGFPKTLVFVKSINQATLCNIDFREMLGTAADIRQGGKLIDYVSEHFSSSISGASKNRIMKDFSSPNGYIKVLFSTIAYGMGLDNKTIRRVIIWGCDKDPASLWQKVSRGCRDGMPGTALLYGNLKMMSVDGILSKNSCIRKSVLESFIGYREPLLRPTCSGNKYECKVALCCSSCLVTCVCQ